MSSWKLKKWVKTRKTFWATVIYIFFFFKGIIKQNFEIKSKYYSFTIVLSCFNSYLEFSEWDYSSEYVLFYIIVTLHFSSAHQRPHNLVNRVGQPSINYEMVVLSMHIVCFVRCHWHLRILALAQISDLMTRVKSQSNIYRENSLKTLRVITWECMLLSPDLKCI